VSCEGRPPRGGKKHASKKECLLVGRLLFKIENGRVRFLWLRASLLVLGTYVACAAAPAVLLKQAGWDNGSAATNFTTATLLTFWSWLGILRWSARRAERAVPHH
jgi:hypothetical protein